jgi:hypothetical protein
MYIRFEGLMLHFLAVVFSMSHFLAVVFSEKTDFFLAAGK